MREQDGIGDENSDIRDIFSYNLQRLAGVSSRIAVLTLKPKFQLNQHDWRALAVLDYLGPAPLQVLAQRAGVQKSQMSRTTAGLESRRLISRADNPEDKRSSLLQVTPEGRELVRQALADARLRNQQMLRHLDEDERRELMRLLGKATRGSLEYLAELKRGDGPAARQIPAPQSIIETEEL